MRGPVICVSISGPVVRICGAIVGGPIVAGVSIIVVVYMPVKSVIPIVVMHVHRRVTMMIDVGMSVRRKITLRGLSICASKSEKHSQSEYNRR